jgi:hypothetical protein
LMYVLEAWGDVRLLKGQLGMFQRKMLGICLGRWGLKRGLI